MSVILTAESTPVFMTFYHGSRHGDNAFLTEPELMLRKALWRKGLRYRTNYKKLPGKPDIVFTRVKIAVFCDGDFWHGHNWALRGINSLEEELNGYTEFWRKKILCNIERDKVVTNALEQAGWQVIRFYESDIRSNLDACVDKVIHAYKKIPKP